MFSSFFTMSPFKQQAFGVGRRLFKSLATSTVALSAVVGGVLLSGGEAKALTCNFSSSVFTSCNYGPAWPGSPSSPIPPGPSPVAIGPGPNGNYTHQWLETNFSTPGGFYYYPTDKDIWFENAPTDGFGVVEWYWQDRDNSGTWLIPPDKHSVDEWHVDVDFDPDLPMPGMAPKTSILEYVVIIDKGQGGAPHLPWNPWFEDVTLGAIFGPPMPGNGGSSTVTKEIYEAICTASTPGGIFDSCSKGSLIDTLTVSAAGPGTDMVNLKPYYLDKLWIIDTAMAKDNMIDAYQNVYRQVPGPLPILGAGAALGFSRKLRGRIKVSRRA
jgi:hypothetical protein